MKITPWTAFYLGVAAFSSFVGLALLDEAPRFSPAQETLYFVVPLFFLFATGSTFFRLSTRYSKSEDKRAWRLPVWSSSPLKNPQSNRLFQVLGFGALGATAIVAGILEKKNYEFGVLSLAMGAGILSGWMFFRLKQRLVTVASSA
jgi:hypothetical protein